MDARRARGALGAALVARVDRAEAGGQEQPRQLLKGRFRLGQLRLAHQLGDVCAVGPAEDPHLLLDLGELPLVGELDRRPAHDEAGRGPCPVGRLPAYPCAAEALTSLRHGLLLRADNEKRRPSVWRDAAERWPDSGMKRPAPRYLQCTMCV